MKRRTISRTLFRWILLASVILVIASPAAAQSWKSQNSATSLTFESVYFKDTFHGIATGVLGDTVYVTTNGGITWPKVTMPTFRIISAVALHSSGVGVAAGEFGDIIRTTDGGANWTLQTNGWTNFARGVHFADASVWVAVGNNGSMVRSVDGGINWPSVASGVAENLWDVHFADASAGLAVGENGTVLRTTDGGVIWTTETSGVAVDLRGVHMIDSNTAIAVGAGGTILRSANGGVDWTSRSTGTSNALWSVHFGDANHGTAVGEVGTALRSTDGGVSWNAEFTGAPATLFDVYHVDADVAYAVGQFGTIVRRLAPGDRQWSNQNGSSNDDEGKDVVVDTAGVFVAGLTLGTLPGETSAGSTDAFFQYYDFDGTLLLTEQFGTASVDEALAIAANVADVYVGGFTTGTLPGQTSQGARDAFLRLYDLLGVEQWTRQFGTALTDQVDAVAVDATGIYVVGVTFGTLPGQTNAGDSDAFIRKYDVSGNEIWTTQFGTGGFEVSNGIAVVDTFLYVTGSTDGQFAGQPLSGGTDVWVGCFDISGNQQWVREFGTTANDSAGGVAADPTGVYVTGFTRGTLPGQSSLGNEDVWVRKYDTNGNELWTDQFGLVLNGDDRGADISADASGIYIAGHLTEFLEGTPIKESFVRKYDSVGSEIWTQTAGNFGSDVVANGVAVGQGASGPGVYATGSAFDFLFSPSAGGKDLFVLSHEPGPQANLNVDVVSFAGPSIAGPGEEIGNSMSLTIRNTGTDDIPLAFTVGLYLSPGDFIETTDPLLTNGVLLVDGGLAAGETRVMSIPANVALPPVAALGNGFLGVIVDNANIVLETNEGDNQSTSSINVDGNLDTDGDGVLDIDDDCPTEDASFFDSDGDGCIDDPRSARHREYRDRNEFPITYVISETSPIGISDLSERTAVQNAFDTWNAVPGAVGPLFAFGGTTPDTDANAMDGVNIVTFNDPDLKFPAGVLAFGISTSFDVPTMFGGELKRPGQIVDSDMIFNKKEDFSTATAGSGSDLQSTATHEALHLIGISHSAVQNSTMFFRLPAGTNAATPETEDILMLVRAYVDSATAQDASRLVGTVTDGLTANPVIGAIVYAIDSATGDTLACDYTLEDGSYTFLDLPNGDYYVAIHPLNGSSAIGFIQSININQFVFDNKSPDFPPEFWDGDESNDEDPMAQDVVTVATATTAVANLITNVDMVAPFVTSVSPDSNATNVPFNSAVVIGFSEPMDDGSLQGNFALTDTLNDLFIIGNAVPLLDDSVISFVPTDKLDFDTVYRLRLGTGVSDAFGNGLDEPFVMYFKTEVQPDYAITDLVPSKGVVGSTFAIHGFGLDQSDVRFDSGVFGSVLEATPTRLVVEVPVGATTGPVRAEEGGGVIVTNTLNFTVLTPGEVPKGFEDGVSDLNALPRSLTVVPDGTLAFVATDAGVAVVNVDPSSGGYLQNTSIAIAGGLNELDVTPDGDNVYAVSKDNERLYQIKVDPIAGHQVIADKDVGARPRGILVEPLGRRAYVTTDESSIQIWDIQLGSSTFNQQIGSIEAFDSNLRGKMDTDPAGSILLALSGLGKVLVFDIQADSLLAEIPVGTDPRDIVVDPAGPRAYVTDEFGQVSVVSLDPYSFVQDIQTGGTLRGVDITPAGGLLFPVNRELNQYSVIDLRLGSDAFRAVAANIALRVNPVDVELSPDGLYAFSLSELEKRLVSTVIGIGPVINSLSRYAAPFDATVVIEGSGFLADSSLTVSFNGMDATPSFLLDSTLVVTVPSTATSGPVKLLGENPTGPVTQSNSVFFEVLDPTPDGGLRIAQKIGASGASEALAVSPLGDIVAVGGETGELLLLDADTSSPTFNQFLPAASITSNQIEDVAITPDGKRAFALSPSESAVSVVDVNRGSATFGEEIDALDIDLGDTGAQRLAISPNGHVLAISDPGRSEVQVWDIRPDVMQYVTSVDVFDGGLNIGGNHEEVVFHPAGEYLYVGMLDEDPAAIQVVRINPADPSDASVVNTVLLPGSVPTEVPIAMSFTPDGNRCLVHTSQLLGVANHTILVYTTTDPSSPILDLSPQPFGGVAPPRPDHIHVSPAGDRAVFNISQQSFYYVDINTTPQLEVLDQSFVSPINLITLDFGFAPDASRMFAIAPTEDSLYVYDFTAADALLEVSGDSLTGVINQTLPAPLKVMVENMSTTQPVGGVPVTFTIAAGGGSFVTDDPSVNPTNLVATTGADGIAQVKWRAGSVIGATSQQVNVTALGLSGSPIQFFATTVNDPDSLPLTLSNVTPFNGQTSVEITTATLSTFSRAVDSTSVNSGTFYLHKGDFVPVPIVVGFTDEGRKLSMTPVLTLEPNTPYTIEMTSGLLDSKGEALTNPQSTTFTTAAPPPLTLGSVSPPSATRGLIVVLSGSGFDPIATNNTVRFNNVEALVTEAGDDFLDVEVPLDAVSGPVTIQVGSVVSNAIEFVVLIPDPSPVDEVVKNIGTGSGTRGVSLTPDGAWAYAVSPEADVIIPINLETLQSEQAIPVGDTPFSVTINPQGTFAYVTDLLDGTVSIVDISEGSTSFQQRVDVLSVGTTPTDAAIHPDGDRLVVANAGSSDLSVVDSDSLSETFHTVISNVGTGGGARSVSITPDGALWYVGADDGYTVIDALDYGVVKNIGTGSGTRGTLITPDGAFLIILTTEGEVDIVDIVEGSINEDKVIKNIGTGSGTRSTTLTPDGTLLYLVQEEDDIIIVVSLEVLNSVSAMGDGVDLPPSNLEVAFVDTIMAGEDPSDIAFAPNGSGIAVVTNPGDNTVSVYDPQGVIAPPIAAELRMFPRILVVFEDDEDLRWWQVRYIRAWIELPPEFNPADIDVSSVRLQGVVPAEPGTKITDVDWDGIQELRVKFDRVAFQDALPNGWIVPVDVTGEVDGQSFRGETTILTIRPLILFPHGGEHFIAGQTIDINWSSPEGYDVDSVDVHCTLDDGATWEVIAQGIEDTGTHSWTLPHVATSDARVLVTLFAGGQDVGSGMSPETFTIDAALPVALGGFEARRADQSAELEWQTLLEFDVTGFHLLRSQQEAFGYERITAEVIPSKSDPSGSVYRYYDTTVRPNQTYYYKLEEVNERGDGQVFGPFKFVYRAEFSLSQNVPNPFNPTTTIKFTIAKNTHVKLAIYDVAGRRVRTLVNGQKQANHYAIEWDGRDANGRAVSSGVYFYKLEAGKFRQTRKMVMLK